MQHNCQIRKIISLLYKINITYHHCVVRHKYTIHCKTVERFQLIAASLSTFHCYVILFAITMSGDNDEQLLELEALESIYPTELSVVKSNQPREYIITLSNSDTTDDQIHTIQLHITLPHNYPSTEACTVVVHSGTGTTNDDCRMLQSELEASINELHQQQAVAIFVLAQHTQDWLNDYKSAPTPSTAIDSALLQPQIKQPSPLGIEAGTTVTLESFRAWKIMFAEEQARLAQLEKSKINTNKLTGKQLFLSDLATDEFDDMDGVDVDYTMINTSDVYTANPVINSDLFDDDDVIDDDDDITDNTE